MKRSLILGSIASLILMSCERSIVPPAEKTGTPVGYYQSRSVLNGDTIRTEDGRLAVIQCRCDTTYLDETERPIIGIGSSSVRNWPDSSFAAYDEYVNMGVGGITYGRIRSTFKWDSIIALNPKQVILMCGDNDVAEKRSLLAIQTDFQWIVDRLASGVPDIEIIWVNIKPTQPNKSVIYPSGETGWHISEYFNRNMLNWVRNKYPSRVLPVDIWSKNILWNPKRLNTLNYNSDLVHLNRANGYRILDGMVRPKLKN
jgi:hypothetical protein